jgi:hypothetical protein
MNDKLWTVKKNRYSKKLRIFHSEENLSSFLDYLATSSILTEATVTLYNKREIYDGASYLKMKERAYKLNHTLDNISELEKNIINLMSYLEANNFSDKKIYKRLKSLKMLPNKFKGKNFVFDERLGERISDDVIATCHLCKKAKCDNHYHCKNQICHTLFIGCADCLEKKKGYCGFKCAQVDKLPENLKKPYAKYYNKYIRKRRQFVKTRLVS